MKRLPALIVLALACVAPAGAQTTTLNIGTTPTDTGAQVYYALDLGLFKKAGFDVNVSSLNAGTAIATAVSADSFDIGQSAVSSLAVAHEHGLPFVIIAEPTYEHSMREALEEMAQLDFMEEAPLALPMETSL